MGTKHLSAETMMEIKRLRSEGQSQREIGKQVGLSLKQIREFFERQHKRERDVEKGYIPKPKGRARKNPNMQQERIPELEREVEV